MKRNNNTWFYVLIAVGVAFFFGYKYTENKKKAEKKLVEEASKQGIDYVKLQANVTKDWFNQIKNTIKQVWK